MFTPSVGFPWGVLPLPTSSFTLVSMTLVNQLGNPINQKTDIIGLDGLGFSLLIQITGGSASSAPVTIPIQITFEEPATMNPGMGSVLRTLPLEVPQLQDQDDDDNVYYQLNLSAKDLYDVMLDLRFEVATVVRQGGTSDADFRQPLLDAGWTTRGMSRQPHDDVWPPRKNTSDVTQRIPDARRLFLAGGVEVLQVTTSALFVSNPQANTTWAFIRSPADVFFYTGHGSRYGPLITETDVFWVQPEDLVKYWRVNDPQNITAYDMNVLILSCCNVLRIKTDEIDIEGTKIAVGQRWADLLWSRGGPLLAICGNYNPAPADGTKNGGNAIAAGMGQAVAQLGGQYDQYVMAWLKVNQKLHQYMACGMDDTGFYHLSPNDGSIKGPFLIPPSRK